MKIQKLTIHNLASIEDAEINFEENPLADSEVFLITGKTGSGKSTILDAICLALYADTPRLNNTKMQGDSSDGDRTLKVNDPRQLMRRNTAEAFAALTFTGKNGVHYEAKWSVARARRRVTGNLQAKEWALKNLDTDTTFTREREIEAEIKEAIGLDFKQFCRTTMLAQGEFTRFLNSEDNEKAAILEKITGVDIYSKIGAMVFQMTGEKKKAWDLAQERVDGTITLSATEIEEKRQQIANLNNEYNTQKTLIDNEIAKRDWIREDDKLSAGVTEAEKQFKEVKDIVDSDDFKKTDALVKEWNSTIEARGWLTEGLKAKENHKNLENELDRLSGEYATLLGGQAFAKQEAADLYRELLRINNFLESEKDKAAVYENAQTIVGHLKTIDDGRKFIEDNNAEIQRKKTALATDYQPELEKAKAAEEIAKGAFKQQDEEVKKQETEVEALKLPELRAQFGAARDLIAKIGTAKVHLGTLSNEQKRMKKTAEELADRLKKLEAMEQQSSDKDGPLHDAKLVMDSKKEALDKQKDTVDKFAQTLRLKLHVGDTCPVCRQRIAAELPHEEALATLVAGLQEDFAQAEKKFQELNEDKNKLDAAISAAKESYDNGMKAYDEDNSVAIATKKALVACTECGIATIDDHTLESLDKLEEETVRKRDALDLQIQNGDEKVQKVRELRDALEVKRQEVERLGEATRTAEKAVTDCQNSIKTAEALVEAKRAEVMTAEANAKGLVVSSNWQNDWTVSPTAFAAELTGAANTYNASAQKKVALDSAYLTADGNCKMVEDVLQKICGLVPEWSVVQAAPAAKMDNLLDKVNTVRTSVTTALEKLKSAQEIISSNREQLTDFFREHEGITNDRLAELNNYTSNQIAVTNALLDEKRNAVVSRGSALDAARQQQTKHQQSKPQLTAEDTVDLLDARIAGLDVQIRQIMEGKGGLTRDLEIDQENKERLAGLIEDVEKKKAEHHRWYRLNELIGDAKGNKFRKIAQSYVLANLIHSANKYMSTLTDRYTLKVQPGEFVILIEDAYQGFSTRATSTISGGESFLVSLALALALSDIGSSLSVDTLFIDEGFGTLSGEPLQNAVNTLRALHSKSNRHVGIISHVEELQERIPVQIQVNQDGNNSSSKIKVVS